MARFVSEPIEPLPGAFGTEGMERGEPGLPPGFVHGEEERRIEEVLDRGKTHGTDRGDVYVRRHTYRLRMDDGAVWNVYFLRQPPRGASPSGRKRRWFLRSIE